MWAVAENEVSRADRITELPAWSSFLTFAGLELLGGLGSLCHLEWQDVKNWPAYLLTLLKKFDVDVVNQEK